MRPKNSGDRWKTNSGGEEMTTFASRKFNRLFVLLIVIVLSPLAFSQNANNGEIKGTVFDPSNAVVPGAKIAITNLQTGVSTTTTTNGSGIYDVPSVPPGRYSLTFSKSGFRDLVRQGITVELGVIAVDAVLQLGVASQQVVVTADTQLVQTESSDQQVTFDARAISDAPIVGGVWYNSLTGVLPGVNGGGGAAASGQGVGINGTQGFNSSWLLEGANVTDPRDYNPSDNYPPVDAIQAVTANTANFGAQYGNGVAAFNVVLKSGTNQWHGSLYEFIQNDALNSKNFFSIPHVTSVAPERWNEYGGSFGGPIIKNKLFFFFSYQRNPATTSQVDKTTVPTQAMRNGDFSDPAFKATLYNPNSCAGANCNRTAFVGNQIPSNLIDPVAANIQKLLPLPNLPGLSNNFVTVDTNPSLSQWYVGKIDYQLSSNQRLSGSILEYPIELVNSIDALCSFGFDCTKASPNRNQAAQITHSWTISPTFLNEARIGGVRELDKYTPPSFGKGLTTQIGLQPAYGSNAPADIFPNITVGVGAGVDRIAVGGGTHAILAQGGYTASDVLTLIRGKHTIKIGGEFDKNYQNYTNWGDVSSGNFSFTGIGTNNTSGAIDPRTGGQGPGIPYADFLMGEVQGWFVFDSEATSTHTHVLGAFIQDDFKVTPHLTMNLGMRYQFQSGWDVSGNKFGVFDPTLPNPGPFLPPNAMGALLYGGKNGRDKIENNVHEFAPRLGFAWAPWKNWSVRASYGIFDTPRAAESYTDGALGLGFNPAGSTGFGSTPAFLLKNGPAPNSIVVPTLSTLSPALLNFKKVDYYQQNIPIEYIQELYLDVQHQFPGNFLLDAGYVSTRGTHLNYGRDINQLSLNTLGGGSADRPFPQYTAILGHLFDGFSNYHAFQIRAEKRMSHGLYFLVNYAWSKTMDTGTSSGHAQGVDVWQNAQDVHANYGLSTLDAPHTFNGSVTYELPVGAGRMFPVQGVLDRLVGGWRVSTIFQSRSGVPFTPTVGVDRSGAHGTVFDQDQCFCGFAWFPNRVGNGTLANPSVNQWFDVSAFTAPNGGTLGNSGRDILRGPRYVDVDLSLAKEFRIREGMNLEVRADAFNAFNHPQLALPNSTLGSPSVGQITNTTNFGGPDRVIQLGGRFRF